VNPSTITVPDLHYAQLAPMLVVFGAALVAVLIEAFAPRYARYWLQLITALTGLLVAFLLVVRLAVDGDRFTAVVAAAGSVAIDGPGLFLQGTILLLSMLALLPVAERQLEPGGPFAAQAATTPGSEQERRVSLAGVTQTEIFPLFLFAVGGMLLFPVANDLLTLFVALEVLSLPLYLMCGLARRRRLLSQEAALKYFLLGAFSSAFLLYGIAMVYGYAGTLSFGPRTLPDGTVVSPGIPEAVSNASGNDVLLLLGVALIAVGLLFKISAVPFHGWTPDAYQGAPTPITGFMAACTKIAAFGALLRVMYVAFGGLQWDWEPLIWGVAILTMVAGAVLAITQTDVKRMLAYSSIAHAGFLLVGLSATSAQGVSSVLFYLLAYGFVTVGAFALLTVVRDAAGEATHLSQWAGMGRRSPVVASLLALFLLAFAGIPLTSGFTGKFAVFSAAMSAHATPLVIVGVVSSAIAAFFYVRVIVLMFFSEPAADGPTVAIPSALTTVAVALGATITVVLGVAPQPFLDLARDATGFVR
jgi:NADH-quinone oxidoreductase subunit N